MIGAVDIEDIDARWLSQALGYAVHAVESERVGAGQTGASYRLTLQAGKGPSTLLAKVAAGDTEARERVSPGYSNEVGFYTRLVQSLDIRTPHCWYAAISEDAHRFTLLLEDLAPRVPGVQVEGCDIERAAGALRNLAGLHAPRWNDATLFELDFLGNSMEGEAAEFLGEVAASACEQFVERYEAELGPEDAATMLAAGKLITKWATASKEPFAVIHGDYRLDNLMFGDADDDVVALDWQTMTLSPPARDLAYFLGTSLDIEARRSAERDLVGLYHGELARRGVRDYSFARCFDDYRLGLLQATMITSLGAIFATRERSAEADEMFMAMAQRSCAAIRDLDTLSLLG
jgi:hypothetical protein